MHEIAALEIPQTLSYYKNSTLKCIIPIKFIKEAGGNLHDG
jgi:hypothetical protein